ncbi:hypothetical protein Salat_1234700 [Sesamum alatum]|uniref:Uncharacterized protein n=1 Tax=Sesamum alatum TaxID=300844 RepID=A0AAE1YG23_9LAMI|nr:hypothetical protein Salat_1234300 [Sesamum alatum]KAK4429341.1 hypothetical protein Salat_1234500 [Sesamum alatum]KAK4429342.1 hypothetical protein Salat_1234600 [Sesamum alatum]KAK4429343.1 hypothetical protein Salat_1234700 [Sesamum alatum]
MLVNLKKIEGPNGDNKQLPNSDDKHLTAFVSSPDDRPAIFHALERPTGDNKQLSPSLVSSPIPLADIPNRDDNKHLLIFWPSYPPKSHALEHLNGDNKQILVSGPDDLPPKILAVERPNGDNN